MDVEEVSSRIEVIKTIKRNNPKLKIFAFSLVMRCPTYSSSDEEPDYYEQYGERIFKYGVNEHKYLDGLIDKQEYLSQKALLNVPQSVIEDYTNRRSVNIKALTEVLKLVGDVINEFVILQDDSNPYGYTALDQRIVKKCLRDNNIDIDIYPGSDEGGLTLLARVLTKIKGYSPKICPVYPKPECRDVVPLFEDRAVYKSITAQIESAGCTVSEENDADIYLFCNLSVGQMLDFCGWYIGKANGVDNVVNKQYVDRDLPKFVSKLAELHAKGKAVAVADIAYANGGDAEIARMISESVGLLNIAGYAGWNTSSNTLGTVICQAVFYNFFKNTPTHRRFTAERVYEDTIAKACEQSATLWGGYFRLGANITATSMVVFNRGAIDGSEGFKGVFDGCGYIIDGLNRSSWDSKAFVTTMTETGVLKNIAFINVRITGEGNFLTSGGKGTIENVYVQYKEISAGSINNGTIANFKDGCAMRNVFVDASKATVVGNGATFRILTSGTASGFGGVFGVCPSENYNPGQSIGDRGNNYAAIAYFANFDELKANDQTQEVLAGWNNNGFWNVNNGIPAPEKYVVNSIDLGAKDIDLDILVDNDTVKLNDNTLKIDCTAVGFTFGNVASVTMEGNVLDASGFTFANGKLTVARSAFGYNYGKKEIVVTDDSGKTITIAATLISKVLKNATDYANWIKIANACETENQILGGYFKLGANITVETMVTFERYDVDGLYGFKGVFDGCGYALDGLTATGNAFISCMTKDGVLRNIAFTNAKVAGESNFLCSGGLGTIENVYVQYVSISAGSDNNGTIYNHCRLGQEGGKITGIFADASQAAISGTGASFRLIGGNNNGYNGIFAVCPENYAPAQAIGDRGNNYEAVAYFTSFDELKVNTKTQGVLKGWNSTYWTIVDGVPVFLTK